ncbi:single-stranded DNA-binding protein [Salmonella enterica subsp. enterica serovar Heidelberg]|nr:single-stranded DNA-binding protein [Salmonella enterica subsp. enterica serovar Heidelberg]EEK2418828.1 single-stranded DNA-binding protein [Salmonella enterica subsp. enterica serovar Heidelberg]
MNVLIFSGRLAATPELKQSGDTTLTRFRLIRNEYAGKDEQGNRKEKQVSIPFTAFGKKAELIANNTMVGDQLTIRASVSNNNFTDSNNVERYDYNFEVEDVEFGAPGAEKRKKLAAEGK